MYYLLLPLPYSPVIHRDWERYSFSDQKDKQEILIPFPRIQRGSHDLRLVR